MASVGPMSCPPGTNPDTTQLKTCTLEEAILRYGLSIKAVYLANGQCIVCDDAQIENVSDVIAYLNRHRYYMSPEITGDTILDVLKKET